MKYAHIDENNKLLGWYDKDIHTKIPVPNIEVTYEQWQVAIDNNHNKVNKDGSTELFDFRTEEELLEQAKASKLQQIEADYIASEEQTVEVSGVIYFGGIDSVESIDSYVRLNRLAGNTTHSIWDVNGVEHSLTDSEVDGVILAIGIQASANKFTKKNRKVALANATTIAEVEAV